LAPPLERGALGGFTQTAVYRLAKWHPFLWLLGLTLGLYGVWALTGLPYDDNGIGTALFVASYGLMQPFWLARDVVLRLFGADPTTVKAIVWWLLGSVPYLAADRALTLLFRRRFSPNAIGA